MNILILNWRDIKNPASGGAEQLTHEIAKRWVKWGHEVTQISAGYAGGKAKEMIDGVRIIRLGGWWSVHFLAFWYYFFKLRGIVDVIIDEVHWFPFFTRLYAKNKTILLSCEVANNLFFQIFPWPVAVWGRTAEKFYLWLYKNTPTLAISPSTKHNLVKEEFDGKKITVLPMGVNLPANIEKYRQLPKEKTPTIIYLGRINKQKGAEDALQAFKIVKQEVPEVQLWFVGGGKPKYIEKLKSQINNDIQFFGHVSDEKKFELLARAHILIVPSVHEGWGLIVPEAGAVGTPAVVYNVAGLRDVVEDNVSGIIVDPTPNEMANAIVRLLENKQAWRKLSEKASKKAKKYDWNNTASSALKIIKETYNIL